MIWLILLIGLILRLISLNQSLWLDEAINVLAVKNYALGDLISKYMIGDFHPPGFSILLWIWTRVFGISEIAIRIPSVIFGVLTIFTVYLLGRKIHSKTLGLVAALLLAINPLHIFYSQEARMYSLATLAVSLNMLLFIHFQKKEKESTRERTVYVLSNLLILMSDYVAYLIFPAQLFFLLLTGKIYQLKKWFVGLTISLLLMIWWLPIFSSQLITGSVTSANLPTWKFVVGGFDIKAAPLTLVKFIIGRISLPDKTLYYAILFPICLLFLFILFRGIKFIRDNNCRKLLICWIVLPIIIGIGISFAVPIYSYFRMLYVVPAFLILTALGIISYRSKLRYVFFGAILFIHFFATSVYLFDNLYQRESWKGLVKYLKSVDSRSLVLFESSGTLPPFDYYAQKTINAKGALKDFPARDITDVIDLEMELKDSKEVYLVDYLVEISDSQRFAAKKLVGLGYKIGETLDFNGVGFVYHYVKK